MQTKDISRRDLFKAAGALVVTFSLFGSVSRSAGTSHAHIDPYGNSDYLDPTLLDSWLAIAAGRHG